MNIGYGTVSSFNVETLSAGVLLKPFFGSKFVITTDATTTKNSRKLILSSSVEVQLVD